MTRVVVQALTKTLYAAVTQMARVPVLYTGGCLFESGRQYHLRKEVLSPWLSRLLI